MNNTGLDSDGYIVNQASFDLISDDYKIVLDFIIEQFKNNNLISNIHSVYLYGSIPRGKAVKFQSDLDLIILTTKDMDSVQNESIDNIKEITLGKFNFITKIDMPVCSLEKIQLYESRYDTAFRIKNSSVCIYGNNIADSIDKYKPTRELAFAFNQEIYELLDKYKSHFNKVTNEKLIILLSKQIGKKIVRSLFGTIIEEKQVWCDSFEEMALKYEYFFPDDKSSIIDIYQIARNGTTDKNKILGLIDKFESKLKDFYCK